MVKKLQAQREGLMGFRGGSLADTLPTVLPILSNLNTSFLGQIFQILYCDPGQKVLHRLGHFLAVFGGIFLGLEFCVINFLHIKISPELHYQDCFHL